jgi:hypothetical protein
MLSKEIELNKLEKTFENINEKSFDTIDLA